MYMLISSGPFTERKDRLHSVATALANNVLPEVDAHTHTVQKANLAINTIVTVRRLIRCCLAYIWMRWREHVKIIVCGRVGDMRASSRARKQHKNTQGKYACTHAHAHAHTHDASLFPQPRHTPTQTGVHPLAVLPDSPHAPHPPAF